jgi:hypothetical protein
MKSFKQLMLEVAQPKSQDELEFKDKHMVTTKDYPVPGTEHQFKADMPKAMRKAADYRKGEDMAVYEAQLDPVGQEDDDINNDGKVDAADRYLHRRRRAISKAIKNEAAEELDEAGGLSAAIKRAEASRQRALKKAASMVKKGFSHEAAAKNYDVKVDDLKRHIKEAAEDLDEISDKKLDAYRQKAFADQPAGDDGSEKYRKRKFGRDLAFAKQTGRAKVRATKEEVELDENLGKSIKKMKFWHSTDPRDVKNRVKNADPEFRKKLANQTGKLGGPAELQRRLARKMSEEVEINENHQMAIIGRKLQQMAPKEKNDMISNAMANLGDHLETYGTTFGARNMKELERKTGLTAKVIKMLIQRAGGSVNESVNLTENFKTGSLTLNDGSRVIVSKQNADLLNQMFNDLNPTNRREMMKVAMKDKDGFNEILGFAREAL